MKRTMLIAVCLAALALPLRAGDRELVHHWPDGSVKIRHEIDDSGARDGKYFEFHENGKPKIKCVYRRDVRHGAFTSYHENGRRHIVATYKFGTLHGRYTEKAPDQSTLVKAYYKDGELHGKRTIFRDKAEVSTQKWEGGRLVTLDGIEPFPRTLNEINRRRADIAASGQQPEEPLDADRHAALRLLKEARYVVGVPYRELRLDDELNRISQAAAELLKKFGDLSHEPPNPGLPEADYRYALNGTRNGNLSSDHTSVKSLEGYLYDSDSENVDSLGHRSWCLNPALEKTGFGVAAPFTAMWAMDKSGGTATEFDLISWPTRGYMPTDLFGAGHAFSIWATPANREGYALAEVKAELFELDENYVRAEHPLPLERHLYSKRPFGPGPALIFRPKALDISPGSRYAVVFTGPKGKCPPWFLVEFY